MEEIKKNIEDERAVELINEDFIKSGELYKLMNDIAEVRDREIKRRAQC